MDRRASLGGQRPRPPQRAVSGGSYGLSQPAPKRPTLPSGLSHIRSVSQPLNVVDLTSDGTTSAQNNVAAYVENGEAVVKSPDVINLEDDIEEPPAKRVKISGAEFKTEEPDMIWEGTESSNHITVGTPLPKLPKASQSGSRNARQTSRQTVIDPASRKADGINPPAIATRVPPPKKAADFSPWTGSHPEDVLNENVVKTGYMDKAQGANQAESNSAKAAMSSSLGQKNSHGLSLLGYMFTQVLEKRLILGKCTTPSAFKPPPRVTVTDTKREAWLRDLANPEVPLRKQSRTIPHGIRGKLLMEQCLSKDIPLQRAVWLAKCVGANELRAFRRKGVSGSAAASGESKWVREWTVHVEQFLEDVIASCGQEGWRQKMNYAVKLSAAFYSERLLDAEHYLDWIVSSLASASLERLPIWLILTQLYWKEIVMYVRRGRELAEGILEHLHGITGSGLESHATLRLRLQKLLAVLAVSNRGCLIIPRTWQKYKYLLNPTDANSTAQTPAANITRRNERLVRPILKTAANTRSPLLDLYDELDSIDLNTDLPNLAIKGLQIISNVANLVSAILEWSSTRYRTGISRVFVSAALIAHLHASGHDTDSAILQYLAQATSLSDSSIDLVHRVIVDLNRLEAFSISRYFQWLLASGVSLASGGSVCAVHLITAFAPGDLPSRLQNTRGTLIKRLGYLSDVSTTTNWILRQIDDVLARDEADHVRSVELPHDMSLAAKYSVCQEVLYRIGVMAKDDGVGRPAFVICRSIVERMQDLRSLASLVGTATTTNDTALLATVADTTNFHAKSFAAFGEFRRLSEAVMEQYLLLRSQQPLDRTLILSLVELAQRTPEKAAFVKLLENDLVICDQQYSAVVCSPASDSLTGMHASNIDSDDDVDAVFASGNTMDEQLMHRVFHRVMQRTLKTTEMELESTNRISSWLNQLRSVEASGAFEDLVQGHVRTIINGGAGGSFPTASIVYLVVSGSLTLGTVADIAKDSSTAEVAVDVLALFLSNKIADDFGLYELDRYRFYLYQKRCREEHPEALMRIFRTACGAPLFDSNDPDLISFIVWCISTKPETVDLVFENGSDSRLSGKAIGNVISSILAEETHLGDMQTDKAADLRRIIGLANPLSIRFCVTNLKHLKATTPFDDSDESTLTEAILQTFNAHSDVWPQVLEFAGEAVNGRLHSWAEDALLGAIAETNTLDDSIVRNNAPRYLDLLAVATRAANVVDNPETVTTITERLKHLDKALSETDDFEDESRERFKFLVAQLSLALDLCAMLVHGPSNEGEVLKQAESNLLIALCALLVHSNLQSRADTTEYLFDLSSSLADKLSDTATGLIQQQAINLVLSDTRVKSILGITSNALDSWLVLASQVQPVGSQQQRALSKHVPQQHQSTGRPSPGSQGSQNLHPQHQRMASFGGSGLLRQDSRIPVEMKTTPFPLHSWEIMPEVMGENNTSLDLKLFGARKV